jgi:hypothetical protein
VVVNPEERFRKNSVLCAKIIDVVPDGSFVGPATTGDRKDRSKKGKTKFVASINYVASLGRETDASGAAVHEFRGVKIPGEPCSVLCLDSKDRDAMTARCTGYFENQFFPSFTGTIRKSDLSDYGSLADM